MQTIIEVMQNADSALHLHQIVSKSNEPEHVVRAFIREQSAFGNVEVVPTRGRYGNRYEWVGPLTIKEEMLEVAKEAEAESVAEAQLEPTAEPENATIEPNQATNAPETFTNEPKDMTNAEDTVETPSVVMPPISVKVGYMITAAKGKIERRKSHEAAKRLAGRWANEGHKNVVIHLTSEYERACIKPEVQFSRA